ncbi:hypothetical protein EYC58_04795 [Candidatus Saccharibacteria bacterium]|nr:MAG: hypothetical protein EYC58_04795 [Candidatus Saccharibacteria bacterium]
MIVETFVTPDVLRLPAVNPHIPTVSRLYKLLLTVGMVKRAQPQRRPDGRYRDDPGRGVGAVRVAAGAAPV